MPSGVAAEPGASTDPVPACVATAASPEVLAEFSSACTTADPVADDAATGGRMDRGVPTRLPARLLARLPALATAVPGVRRRGGDVDGGLGGTYDDGVDTAVSLSITDFATMGDLGIQNTNTARA